MALQFLRFDIRGSEDPILYSGVFPPLDFYCLLQELGIEHANVLGCSLGGEMATDFTL